MDLSHKYSNFVTGLSRIAQGPVPASPALTAELARDLLTSRDSGDDAVVSALQESLRQFDSLLSCVSGTFYRCHIGRPWQLEFVSPGIEKITGYAPSHFAQHPFEEIIEPEHLSTLAVAVEEAIARRETFTATYRIRHKSGEIRWVSETGRAICNSDDEPLFLEGFITDITETKTLELEAEESRKEIGKLHERMSRIVESSLDGVVIVDSEWNYIFANNAAMEQMPTDGSFIGENALDGFDEIRNTPAWPKLQWAMEKREPVRSECYLPRVDRWYEMYVVPDGDGLISFFKNITDRKRLEKGLVERANSLRTTLDSIPDMVCSADPEGNVDYFNRSWAQFVGLRNLEADSDFGLLARKFLHEDDRADVFRRWLRSMKTGEHYEQEFRLLHHSGTFRWMLARATPQRDEDGKILRWYGTCTDIHDRIVAENELRESQNLQSSIMEASADSISILDLEGRVLLINAPALRAKGSVKRSHIVGSLWPDFWTGKYRSAARRAISKARKGNAGRFTGCISAPKGRVHWWDVLISPIRDAEGEIKTLLCIARDITEQKKTAERLRIASEGDFLTSLPNRRAFETHLKKIAARARDTGANIGLMLLDLDHFKHVNDTLGHLAGDHLLQILAKRLKACVSDSGFVARLGGDEFAIVLDNILEEKELIGAATQVLAKMEEPVTFSGRMIHGGLSIGCAIYPRDAENAQDLFKHADTALYDLKASGRGGIQMFNDQMMEAAERSASQLNLARRVVQNDAVEPYYQPKVRLETGEVAGFEALLRWWSPGNGIQPPASVSEAFNDYELSTKIGGLMQCRVFEDMADWLDTGLELPPISINAAPAEFARDDYGERLLERLEQYGIAPTLVELEITEHVFLHRRTEQVVRALQLLNQSGMRIALDDFGTGHSSLSYLRDFPVDVIKIDRSFVSRMLTNRRMLAIVEAITKLGPSLSLEIVAEGVETPEQLHALRDVGCDLGQGYFFGKAMHADEVAWRLGTGNWTFKLT